MPRTSHKKRLLNPHKSQLLFKEAPVNGPKHDYGPQLRSAINPRSFLSEKQQRDAAPCTSWVSPQFNSLQTTTLGQGKRNNQMATRISNKASVLCLPQTRRNTVCKYTSLLFEGATGQGCKNLRSSRTKNNRLVSSDKELRETPKSTQKAVDRRIATRFTSTASRCTGASKKQSLQNLNIQTTDSVHTPNTSYVPEPPNVETPEMPHCSSTSPSSAQHLLFPSTQAKTPPRTENTSVLVKDTPEKDFGLRVTWRRRKEIMKLLIDRGQLLPTDAEVTSEWT